MRYLSVSFAFLIDLKAENNFSLESFSSWTWVEEFRGYNDSILPIIAYYIFLRTRSCE